MKLKRALEIGVEFNQLAGTIRVDKNDYICLNDLQYFYSNKRIQNWLANDDTQNFIKIVENKLADMSASLTSTAVVPTVKGVIRREGRAGGTWAHRWIAMEFAMWLSPEFKLKVIQSYESGTQQKQDWNIKRILAAENYKIMTKAVQEHHTEAQSYHYANEADLLNQIVFGFPGKNQRDTASEKQLDDISLLERDNATMLNLDMPYGTRKEKLTFLYQKRNTKQIS